MAEMSRFEKWLINRRGPRSFRRLLDRLARAGQLPMGNASRVLELGAGNGALSIVIQERFQPAGIWVTDYDGAQVVVARRNFEAHFGNVPPSVTLEEGDGTHLAYPDHVFDVVIAHYVLHHFGDSHAIVRGLDEVARVLKPGGRLLYAEMFHTAFIREHLLQQGFTLAYQERRWRGLTTAEVIVAVSPGQLPARP